MEDIDRIKENTERLLKEIPAEVTLLAAAKTRTPEEVRAAWQAGIHCFGHNYVQEAQAMLPQIDLQVEWHMIGHLQRNKANLAVSLFDLVETLDSPRLARTLEKHCAQQEKVLPVFIEVNSGREENKDGALPEDVDALAELIGTLPHLQLQGLMTMGPLTGDAELSRPYFKTAREIYERIKKDNSDVRWLSMGMSHSYLVAIDEGANLVRIGTALFGPRK
jgi:pyridoxal phosphate enzyme (YggS family)